MRLVFLPGCACKMLKYQIRSLLGNGAPAFIALVIELAAGVEKRHHAEPEVRAGEVVLSFFAILPSGFPLLIAVTEDHGDLGEQRCFGIRVLLFSEMMNGVASGTAFDG